MEIYVFSFNIFKLVFSFVMMGFNTGALSHAQTQSFLLSEDNNTLSYWVYVNTNVWIYIFIYANTNKSFHLH